MSLSPYDLGVWNCQSDAYENSPFYSVGGLDSRGDLQRPSWISETSWPDYRRGYEDMARRMFGERWRTVEFGWAPTITLKSEDKQP